MEYNRLIQTIRQNEITEKTEDSYKIKLEETVDVGMKVKETSEITFPVKWYKENIEN